MTHFFSFLNIASYKCGYILSNKTHFVTVHHATITKNSSCQLWTASSTKPKTLVTPDHKAEMEQWRLCSIREPRQHRDPALWQQMWSWAESSIINPATHINFTKKSRAGSLYRKSRGLPRGTVSVAEKQPVPALGKPLTEKVMVEASLAGGCSPFFIFPQTYVTSLPPLPGLSFLP